MKHEKLRAERGIGRVETNVFMGRIVRVSTTCSVGLWTAFSMLTADIVLAADQQSKAPTSPEMAGKASQSVRPGVTLKPAPPQLNFENPAWGLASDPPPSEKGELPLDNLEKPEGTLLEIAPSPTAGSPGAPGSVDDDLKMLGAETIEPPELSPIALANDIPVPRRKPIPTQIFIPPSEALRMEPVIEPGDPQPIEPAFSVVENTGDGEVTANAGLDTMSADGTTVTPALVPGPKPDYFEINPLPPLPAPYEPWERAGELDQPFVRPYSGEPLPLYRVMLEAIRRSPDVEEARAQLEFAEAGLDVAKAPTRPNVSMRLSSGREVTGSNAEPQVTRNRSEANLTVRQLLLDFGVTRSDIQRNEALLTSAEFLLREQIQSVSLQAAEAVLTILESRELLQFARENIQGNEQILELVRLRFEGGNGTEADVQRVEARLSAARSELVDLEGRLRQASDTYRRLVGSEPDRLITPALPRGILPVDEFVAIEMGLRRNPGLLTLRSDEDSLRLQRQGNQNSFRPRIDFELQGNTSENVSGDSGVSRDMRGMVTMTYQLYDGGRRKAAGRQIDARINQLTASQRLSALELEEAIRQAFTAVTAARNQQAEIRNEIASNRRVNELYLQQFEAGQRNVFDLLDGQQNLFNAQRSFAVSKYDEYRQSYRILERIGILIESQLPDETYLPPEMR